MFTQSFDLKLEAVGGAEVDAHTAASAVGTDIHLHILSPPFNGEIQYMGNQTHFMAITFMVTILCIIRHSQGGERSHYTVGDADRTDVTTPGTA